ncbi:MAG: hypothetical protein A2184_00570 [Candidatus Moranbacteria bacterium RIFOXYA1_FULL_44_7]|nr:MAG: hypothetical protein A2184_00570 [Candidatus Moranbacteria bacterium RIFOXYA1_FULL_44_7]
MYDHVMEVKGEVTSETFKKLDGSLSLADLYQIGTCEVADGLLAIIEGRHKRLKVLFKGVESSHKAQDAVLHAFDDFKNSKIP